VADTKIHLRRRMRRRNRLLQLQHLISISLEREFPTLQARTCRVMRLHVGTLRVTIHSVKCTVWTEFSRLVDKKVPVVALLLVHSLLPRPVPQPLPR